MTNITKAAQDALEALEKYAPIFANREIASLRAALQDKAGEVRDNEVLRQVFALCEDTEGAELSGGSADSQVAQDFMRGRKFEAKQIRRAIGTWFQDEFCGRSFMGEPATDNTTQPAPVVPDGWRIEMAPQWSETRIRVMPPGEPHYLLIEPGSMNEAGGVLYALCRAMIAASQQKGGSDAS